MSWRWKFYTEFLGDIFFTKQIVEIPLFMLNSDISQPDHVQKLDGHRYEYRKEIKKLKKNGKLNDLFSSNSA